MLYIVMMIVETTKNTKANHETNDGLIHPTIIPHRSATMDVQHVNCA